MTLRSGEAYDEVTEAALREAAAVVVLWSRHSVASRWVRAEATLAERNKTFVPAMIEACERPIMFELTQTADLGHWRGGLDDPAWQAFVSDVRRFVERGEPRPTPVQLATGAPLGLPGKPSIAVLPFASLSAADEHHLADGLVEEISIVLSQFSTLFVIAGQSGLAYRDTAKSAGQIARELGVRYLLDGSIRKAAGKVRISAKLVDATTGEQIWAQRYDDALDDVFELQERIANAVAGAIDITMNEAELRRAVARPTHSADAYELYQKACASMRRYDRASIIEARAFAEQAAKLDPCYAWALASVAQTNAILYMNGWTEEPAETRRCAIDYAERALKLGSNDQIVLATVAGVQMNVYGDFDLASQLIERALSLNPQSSVSLFWGGWIDLEFGRMERALERLEKASRLNPSDSGRPMTLIGIGQALFFLDRLDEAAIVLTEAIRLLGSYVPARAVLVATLARSGRLAEAELAAAPLRNERGLLDLLRYFSNREHRKVLRAAFALLDRPPKSDASG